MGLTTAERGPRVLVVGLDGATWGLLRPYARDGTMPNLGGLLESSLWGDLTSTYPPVTAPAWASLSTGKNPGKTGVFAFYTPRDSIERFKPITSIDQQADTLPEALERAGKRVHVINLPTFSFPTKITGTVLGDMLCPPEKVVNPPSLLKQEVFRKYRSFPNLSLKGNPRRYVKDIRELERTRFQCAVELLRGQWDFVFVMFSGVDWIQHELYGDLLHGVVSPATEEAKGFFRDVDRYIGEFSKMLGEEDHLMLVSDHGFEEVPGAISMNQWLMQKGYLKQKHGASGVSTLARRVPSIPVPSRVMRLLSVHPKVWELGRRLWRITAGRGFSGHLAPDPALSVAFSQEYTGGIYINSKRRFKEGLLNSEEEQRVVKEIREGMDALVKEGLIAACVPASEVYTGPFVSRACDLIIKPSNRSVMVTTERLIDDAKRNGHSMRGVYLLHGPRAKPESGKPASIYDVFPTVLSIFGLKTPEDIDGVSMVGSVGGGETPRQEASSSRVLSKEEEAVIAERLGSLGYL